MQIDPAKLEQIKAAVKKKYDQAQRYFKESEKKLKECAADIKELDDLAKEVKGLDELD